MPTDALHNREVKLAALPTLQDREHGRSLKQLPAELKVDAERRIISGYASTFGNWDAYNDLIRPGAFARTIAEKHTGREVSRIKFLWQHRASEALGVAVRLHEDSRGLEFEGKVLHPGELGRVALVLAAEKVIDAFSIGFDVYPGGSRWLELDDLSEAERLSLLAQNSLDDLFWMPPRELSALDLWENSLVTWGANPLAMVEAVKSITRDVTRTLVPGWSPAEARALRSMRSDPEAVSPLSPLKDDGAADLTKNISIATTPTGIVDAPAWRKTMSDLRQLFDDL